MTHTVESKIDYLFELVVNRRGQYIISRQSLRDYRKQYGDVVEVLRAKGIVVLPLGKNWFRIKKEVPI